MSTPDHVFEGVGTLPIVTHSNRSGHALVTFAWHDDAGDAEQVLLFANRLTDETSLDDTLLEAVGDGWWCATFEMETDWRASYAFLVQRRGELPPWLSDGQASLRAALDRGHADPRNPATCRNRAGVTQSVVALPDAPAQPWLERRPDVPRGHLRQTTMADGRDGWLYSPAGLDGERLPLIVVLDGEVWTGTQSLPTTMDNLIADGALPPVHLALPSSGSREQRWGELGGAHGTAWLCETVVPWARAELPTTGERVVLCGQSLGGTTAIRAGLTRPDVVAAVVSQSASLWQDDLAAEVAAATGTSTRFHLAHGRQEWVLTEPHRALSATLTEQGITHEPVEVNGGHDYAWWRGTIADGLCWALGSMPGRRVR